MAGPTEPASGEVIIRLIAEGDTGGIFGDGAPPRGPSVPLKGVSPGVPPQIPSVPLKGVSPGVPPQIPSVPLKGVSPGVPPQIPSVPLKGVSPGVPPQIPSGTAKGKPPSVSQADVAAFLPQGRLTEEQQKQLEAFKEAQRLQKQMADYQKYIVGPEQMTLGQKVQKGFSETGAALLKWGAAMFGIMEIVKHSKSMNIYLSSIFEMLGMLVDVILAPLAPIFTFLLKWLAKDVEVWSWITSGKLGEWLRDVWENAITWMKEKLGPTWEVLADIVGTVKFIIKALVDPLGAAKDIVNWVRAHWDDVKLIAAGVWDSIETWGLSVWDGIKQNAKDAWAGVEIVGKAVWTGIETAGKAVWTGIETAGKNIWNEIKTSVIPAFKDAAGAVDRFIDKGVAWSESFFEDVGDKISGAAKAVATFLTDENLLKIGETIKDAAGKFGGAIKDIATTVADAFIKAFKDAAEGVTKIWAAIQHALHSIFPLIPDSSDYQKNGGASRSFDNTSSFPQPTKSTTVNQAATVTVVITGDNGSDPETLRQAVRKGVREGFGHYVETMD